MEGERQDNGAATRAIYCGLGVGDPGIDATLGVGGSQAGARAHELNQIRLVIRAYAVVAGNPARIADHDEASRTSA